MTYFFPSQDRNVAGATVVETAVRVRAAFFMWGFPAEGYTKFAGKRDGVRSIGGVGHAVHEVAADHARRHIALLRVISNG
jgi:hypothetical protein